MTPTAHLLLMYSAAKEITHFKEATALLRVWANQRGYGKGNKTVFGFEALGSWWGFVLAYLVWGDDERSLKNVGTKKRKGRKPIGKGLSSYQMFRATMDFLGLSISCISPAPRVTDCIDAT
jgi:U3 small nucleolar RNA-associated protein 22